MNIPAKAIFIVAALVICWAGNLSANGEPRPIELSECLEKNCMARDVHDFYPEENIKVQAWFDVVTFADKPGPLFYPLFNVYNYSSNAINLRMGMQLLDESGQVLIEGTSKAVFQPTQNTEASYDTYLSVNALSLTADIARRTAFVRMLYQR